MVFIGSRNPWKYRARLPIYLILVAGMILGPTRLASASNAVGLNQWARDGSLAFKVTAIHCGQKSATSAGGFQTDTAQGIFCVLHITIKNIGNQAKTPYDSTQFLYDTQGRQYSADTSADVDLNPGPIWQFTNLNPGLSISGTLWYDVPAGTQIASLQVHDSEFSAGATISLESASLGAWKKDKVVDGMMALNFQTEELNSTCSRAVTHFGLTPSTVIKAYGSNGKLLAAAPLGKPYGGTDRNSKGQKVKTCNFATHIWIPLNQTKYIFEWSTGSYGKAVFSSALIHKIQRGGFSANATLLNS